MKDSNASGFEKERDRKESVLFSHIRDIVKRDMGLNFTIDTDLTFEKKILAACDELGFRSLEECLESIAHKQFGRREIEVLASHLTVGETYFYRDKKTLDILQTNILQPLYEERASTTKTIRIWSAGCCTGEEPYTIAMMITSSLANWKNWHISILATDINTRFLEKAVKGVYSSWSFRETPPWVRMRFFKPSGENSFQIDPELQRMVSFRYLNLAEDIYPSVVNGTNAIDILFCRNVLMYFAPDKQELVVERLYRSLAEKGVLIVSPVEVSPARFPQFSNVRYDSMTFYTRGQGTKNPDRNKPESQAKPEIPIEPMPKKSKPLLPPQPIIQHKLPIDTPQISQQSENPPRSGSVYHAEYLYKKGDYGAAIEELLRCERDSAVLRLLTKINADRSDFDAALQWCNKLIDSNRLIASSYYLQGTIYLEQERQSEALDALRRALFLDPSFIIAYFTLGTLYKNIGASEKAKIAFANCRKLLQNISYDQIVPESDGIPAGRLFELVHIIDQPQGTVS